MGFLSLEAFMALPNSLQDREQQKFIDVSSGATAVRVSNFNALTPSQYDRIDVTYPSATQEVYTFTLAAAAAGVITVDYVDSTKDRILSVVRS